MTTPYKTLLERRVRALNTAHSRGIAEILPFGETPCLRLRAGSSPVVSPNLKWEELYWWLDGWMTGCELSIPQR